MLRSAKHLEGFTLAATDGDVGSVQDFYFDDERWTVRYLVVGTGLTGQLVLISPIALGEVGPDETPLGGGSSRRMAVRLTRQQVRDAPGIDVGKPVSRQQEIAYLSHHGWPFYWVGPGLWGSVDDPGTLFDRSADGAAEQKTSDPHLRSMREVIGYHIQATDSEIGHVEDFVVDDETWRIRYMVVDTRNWWPGRKVLVSPDWIDRLSWEERKVHVDLSRERIREGPEWDPRDPVNRQYEQRLYDYYGRPAYWR